jgi:dipeptide/tripeptide permease
LAVFGAEQIQESKRTTRYFDKYAVAVNIGSIIPLLAIPYIQTELEHQYYFIPYLLPTSMLFFAAVSFLIGWRYYIHVKTNETVITKCIPVFIDACRSWYRYQKNKRSKNRQRSNSTPLNVLHVSHSFTEIEDSMSFHEQSYTFLDFAKLPNGGFHDRIVEDVKSLRGALIVFTLLIPFWLVYNQVKEIVFSKSLRI